MKFSESEWNSIAGNDFAYCNRLRHSDYCQIFKNNHFSIVDQNIHLDSNSYELLKENFEINTVFKNYNLEDISITSFMTLLINNK